MPIYEYRCQDCGARKDHLQKLSDAPIATCPVCGSAAYGKALTAAGFQLKGNGWYATDFKGNSTAAPAGTEEAKPVETTAAGPACGTGCACH